MSRDFTVEKYEELVRTLKSNYKIMSVADYLTLPKNEKFIAVLRHDVDRFPERAVRMALLEKYGHQTKSQRGTTAPLILSPNPPSSLYRSKPLINSI